MKTPGSWFGHLPIKTKLVAIMLIASALSLLLAGAGFIGYENLRLREDLARDLGSLAKIIGNRTTASLAFNDDRVANENLASLQIKREVTSACIYDAEGRLFARYDSGEEAPYAFPEHGNDVDLTQSDSAHLHVTETVTMNGSVIGKVVVRASLRNLQRLWQKSLLMSALIIGVSGLLALILSARLQRVVSRPLLKLQRTVQSVSEQKNFAIRAAEESNDEFGALSRAFNEMIATVEARNLELLTVNRQLAANEKQLATINENLEARVATRTRELAESNEKLRHNTLILATVLDSMSQGLIAFDRDLGLLVWNRKLSEVRGYPQDMLQAGRHHDEFLRFDLENEQLGYKLVDDRLLQHLDQVRQFQPHRFTRERLDGKVLEISGGPIADGGFVSTYEDVTLRKQAELALKEARDASESANQTKSQFLANMSHELRTPMNGVLGMLHLALQTDMTPSQRNYLSKAYSSARTLLGILNDILDFSKIEAGKMTLENTEFRFDSVVEQLADVIGYQASQKGIEFLIRHDTNIPAMLIGDPLRLGQVLTNLCGNALKFTEHGELELAFRCLSKNDATLQLQVSVRDTGIGMNAEDQARLFQEFTQADQGTSRRFGGTGLGLAISKKLVALMNGRIWIEDSQPGKGTTFCFTAQLGIAAEAEARLRQLERQIGALLAETRVLVVDDNAVSREILAEMLEPFQLQVSCAGSGHEAIATLHANIGKPYDLVLMDWKMPGITGDEAIKRIRADRELPKQPKVIIVTAYGSEEVMRLSEQAGVDGFLVKPVSPSTLMDAIMVALGRERLMDASLKYQQEHGLTHGIRYPGLQGIRVLLVEDNEINREFASELLRSQGVAVDEALNGVEALEQVQRQHYDAVLMDIQMPVMDGLEAAVKIRALATTDKRFADIPIIAMTAHAMLRDVEKSLEAGMNDHVVKPIDPDRLFAALSKWLPAQAGESLAAAEQSAPALSEDLQRMRSVDALQGLRRIGGNELAYRKQLQRFLEHFSNAAGEIRQLLSEGNDKLATERCHALKGVSGNLGANTLFAATAAVERMLKQGQTADSVSLQSLQSALNDLLSEIAALASDKNDRTLLPPAEDGSIDIPRSLDLLKQLRQALNSDLGAAEELVSKLAAAIRQSPHRDRFAVIAELVDCFAIDEAQQQIGELIAALQADSE